MKRTTGAVIGAITGLVIAAAAGSGEVAEASAGVGAIAGATLGAFFTGSRAAEHKTIKPKRKATTTATAKHKIIKSKRRAEIERINLARLPDQSIFKNLPKLKAPAGYVYIIQDVSAWHRYKIGYTTNPTKRIQQIQDNEVGIGTLKYFHIIPTDNANALKQLLHQRYASQRAKGKVREWFDLDDRQLQEIRCMNEQQAEAELRTFTRKKAERKAEAEPERRAKEAERKAEAEEAERKAEAEEAERKRKAEEAERKAKAERKARQQALIKAAIQVAIQAANEAAIMDARIARSAAASNVEHIAAAAIEEFRIDVSHAASEYKRSGLVDAARIAAIEDAGAIAIQAANQAAIIGKGMGMSKSENTSAIRSAGLAAIQTAISTASDGIGGDARIAKIAAEIENARTQKIENARAIANAGKNARIATVDTDVVARAIEEARTDAIKDIIANANTSTYARMVAIEATVAIAIIDIIEAAIETDAAEDDIKSLMEVKIPSAIKEASRAARVYAKPAGLNVPVDNYKNLPKLNAPAGYVYVIQDMSHSQQYKIGRTNHPASRLNRFGVELPIKTEVIAILRTDNAPALERRLHQKFASSQTEGEWFALDAAQIDEIRRM